MVSASPTFALVLTMSVALLQPALASYPALAPVIPVLQDDRTSSSLGDYSFVYKTGNGIERSEEGAQSYGQTSKGGFSYTAPGGEAVAIVFVADQGGYQPTGDVIPIPPPLPYKRVQKFLH